MKWAKTKYRECDCWSLTCDIKQKTKKKHTFTKKIEDKTNSYINERNSTTLDIEIEQKKVKIWEILHLPWAAIPGMDR